MKIPILILVVLSIIFTLHAPLWIWIKPDLTNKSSTPWLTGVSTTITNGSSSGIATTKLEPSKETCRMCLLYPLPETLTYLTSSVTNISSTIVSTNICQEHGTIVFDIHGDHIELVSSHKTFQHRRQSLQCMIGRAIKKMNDPTFHLRFRIYSGDEKGNCTNTLYVSSTRTQAEEGAISFPDFTFESWPETKEYNARATARSVIRLVEAATADFESWVNNRIPKLVWRGNIPYPSKPTESGGRFRAAVRDYLEALPDGIDRYDVKAIGYVPQHVVMKPLDNSRNHKVARKRIPVMEDKGSLSRQDHCQYRYILHMNGLAEAYSSAMKWKFLCGSLVFLPDSLFYYEWWNENLTAFEHYIPFSSPEDLDRKFRHFSSPERHEEAYRIAKNGYKVAKAAFENLDEYIIYALKHFRKLYGAGNKVGPYGKNYGEKLMNLEGLQSFHGPKVCSTGKDAKRVFS